MTARVPRFALAAVALIAALGAALPAVSAAPAPANPVRSVTIVAPRWLYRDADLVLGVRVATRKSSRTVTAELDLLDDSGTSVWHDTQRRGDLGTVTYEFSFSKALRYSGIAPGIFTLRARVASSDSPVLERSSTLIVADRSMRAIPVSVIVRVAAAPSAGPGAGDAERDAALVTATDASDLGQLAVLHPELHLTLAIAPFLLQEWSDAGPQESSTTVGLDVLDSLRRAVAGGTPLLRTLYADPDLSTLATAGADIELQSARGDAVSSLALASGTATPPVAAVGLAAMAGPLPRGAASLMAARGVRYAVVEGTGSIVPARGVASAGAYAVTLPGDRGSAGATLTVLAADPGLSALLGDPAAAPGLAAELFARASQGRARPLVLVVGVGAQGVRTSALAQSLDSLAGVPWVRLVDAPTAAAVATRPAAVLEEAPFDPTPSPPALRSEVGAARARVAGLLAAVGPTDADAMRALDSLLLSESRAWAGADGGWTGADRARALARAAAAAADAVLSKVSLDAPSVTLPGSEGKAPVSILNASDRALTVELEAESSDVRVQRESTTVHLRPGENILSVPVSLGTATSGRVRFTVTAGGFAIASAVAGVTASYQDRFVLLGAALLVLAGLLIYIRRHLARAPAGAEDDGEPDDEVRD